MYPANFQYHAPTSLASALELLKTLGDDAKLLAGGHSLIPMMKLRLVQPAHIIDLRKIPDLSGIREEAQALIIGAMTSHYQIESSPVVRSRLQVLSEVAGLIADPQVRNRGTIGGSVAHSDSAADFPAILLALEAEVICAGEGGERAVKFSDWCTGMMSTALGEGEVLVRLKVPLAGPRTGIAYLKHPHPATHFAVVGVAAAISLDESGKCIKSRIGMTGIAIHAMRARRAERLLEGQKLTASLIEAAAKLAPEGLDAQKDLNSSPEHKIHLCLVYAKRAIATALERARKYS
jgi:carbon-monoxide dehydrogenase medium subunit